MELKLKTNCYELQNFYFECVQQTKAVIIEKVWVFLISIYPAWSQLEILSRILSVSWKFLSSNVIIIEEQNNKTSYLEAFSAS